jgi:hypothetical protein
MFEFYFPHPTAHIAGAIAYVFYVGSRNADADELAYHMLKKLGRFATQLSWLNF